jgi:tetratricopeptide (TPR) repeat protein
MQGSRGAEGQRRNSICPLAPPLPCSPAPLHSSSLILLKMRLLIKLFYNPLQALAEISDRAPYFVGAALALITGFLYYNLPSGELAQLLSGLKNNGRGPASAVVLIYLFRLVMASLAPVLFLGAIFVPAALFSASLVDRRSSFRVLLSQEYAPLVSAILYSWAAAHILMFVPAWLLFQPAGSALDQVAMRLVPLPFFIFLAALAVRVVLRMSYGRAAGVVMLASLSLLALPLIPRLLFLLTSPFLLILLIVLLRNVFGDLLSAQHSRAHFKRSLEISTLNPADASAHYNLGLIYQQRRQYEEALACFTRAVEIDPEETDAHYQLGRIAREQGRLTDAIRHFDSVVSRDSQHSLNEVWREIGHAYLQAAQYEDARAAFERFLATRPSDAEGRYRYGLTLYNLGRADEAATEMRAVIEAVRTSPAYKYRAEKRWMNEAQSFLRSQSA